MRYVIRPFLRVKAMIDVLVVFLFDFSNARHKLLQNQ